MTSNVKSGSKGKDNVLNQVLLWLARMLEQMGKPDLALQIYNSMLKSNSKYVPALCRRSLLWLMLEEKEKALADAAKAAAMAPRDAAALGTRGIVQLLTGHGEAADKDLKKTMEFPEWDARACIFAYMMIVKEGDPSAATDFIRNAVDNKIKDQTWPFPILQFWRGSISMTDLMAQTGNDNSRLLECRAYLGFCKAISKYPLEGKSDLQFVVETKGGSPLAKVMAELGLKRIEAHQEDSFAAKREKADKTAGMDWLN